MARAEPTAEQLKLQAQYEKLPTGKPHVSFSELRDWSECSYRHKLKYIDHIDEDKPGVNMDFGTSVHAACEQYVRSRQMDNRLFLTTMKGLWDSNAPRQPDEYNGDSFKSFAQEGLQILPDIPGWLDSTFPGWEFVDAEHLLYERLGDRPHAFKGYIDCIIRAPGPRNRMLTWLIDWKTCGWGWPAKKKADELVRMQLVLYKTFWSLKTEADPADVRCAFVLLKRTAKPGAHCELVTTSVGDLTMNRTLKVINNMVSSVKAGVAIKNRNNCRFCPYSGTQHCT